MILIPKLRYRVFLSLITLILILINYIGFSTGKNHKKVVVCEKLVFEIKLFNKKIMNGHQYSPKWMLVLNNNLRDKWAHNNCDLYFNWPRSF